MKNKLLILLCFLATTFSYSQLVPREVIRGKILADKMAIENVTIFNVSSNKGAVSDHLGEFAMYARPNDTLYFSNVVFKSKQLVLNENDFKVITLIIRLEEFVNELEEVIVTPRTLTGDLMKDAKNIKVTDMQSNEDVGKLIDLQYEADLQTSLKNPGVYDGTIAYSMDFVKIGQMIGGLFKKDKEEKIVFTSSKNFQAAVKDKFTYHFFTETLGLKQDEIGLFLAYCETDDSVKQLLAVNREIDLIDYLINKSVEYKKIPKE
jgi:hypothetical protein